MNPSGATTSDLVPAMIQAGTVIDVDADRWVCTLQAAFPVDGAQRWYNVPLTSPYLHAASGEGIHFVPEVGASCWICVPSEGDARPFVLGYAPLSDEYGTHRANRPLMNPGDVYLSTRDGNFIAVRRGGVIELGATPLARTLYVPKQNKIVTFFENLQFFGLPGTLEWKTLRPEEDPEGKKGGVFRLGIKEFVDDTVDAVVIEAGAHLKSTVGGNDPLLSISVKEKTTVEVDASGTVIVEGPGASFTIDANGTVTVKADKVKVSTSDETVFYGSTTLTAQSLLKSTDFLTDLNAAMTPLAALAVAIGSSAPVVTLQTNIGLALSTGTKYVTSKVRAE